MRGGAPSAARRRATSALVLGAVGLAAGVLQAACGPATEDAGPETVEAAPPPIVRDSLGITVVENHLTPVWDSATAWRLSAEPSVRIGSVDGPIYEAYGNALAPVRLSDGRIVVADRQTNLIHFFDGAGEHLESVGGTGQGPGEFTAIWTLQRVAGDSLMVMNVTTETSILSPEGEFVRRYTLDPVPGFMNVWWRGRFPDGSMLAYELIREGTRYRDPPPGTGGERRLDVPEMGEFYRDSLQHLLFTGEGAFVDTLMRIPSQNISDNRLWAPEAATRIDGDVFYTSPGEAVEIQSWRRLAEPTEPSPSTPGGLLRLERIVRRPPLGDVTVTEEMREAYRKERLRVLRERRAAGDGPTPPPGFRLPTPEEEVARISFPPVLPAHGNAMRVDTEGNVWLREYRMDGEAPHRWSVFDPQGRWLGVVETPPRFVVNDIGDDWILGMIRRELDVQYVEMYRLEKPGG